jgi:phytoene dehydrogenase-like protein
MTMAQRYQNIIIGGGHNGLTCAAWLARAGQSVLVLEAAGDIGGAARTREFAPGARVSACAHLLHAMPADLARELDLAGNGLAYAAQDMRTVSLSESGETIVFHGSTVQGKGVSEADAAAYPRFNEDMQRFAGALRPVFEDLAPELSIETWRHRLTLLGLGLRIRRLGRFHMRELLRIIGMNLYDLLDEYFESPQLKGAIAMDALLGGEWGARSMGSVLTYLYRVAGYQRNGGIGVALPKGGMGAVSGALGAAARAAGAEIRTGARVRQILVENDRAAGVELDSGERLHADNVISNADPKHTFLKLVSVDHLDTGFVRQIKNLRSRGKAAKLHLLLDGAPRFKGVEESGLGSRLIIAPGTDEIELAFNPSKYGEYPAEPVLEITVPSATDNSLAPGGQHVVSAVVQYVPYDDSPDEDASRAAFLETVLDQLERYAPGIRGQVRKAELLTPRDIEREFGMTGGHWHQVELVFESFLFNRPIPVLAQHHSPVAGLYLCGAACHPGGNVMGIAGRNAARQVLKGGN